MNLSEELLKAIITTAAGILQVLALAVIATGFKMYLDLRSARKSIQALWGAFRKLEQDLKDKESTKTAKDLERKEER